jgi:DNA repair protein RadC
MVRDWLARNGDDLHHPLVHATTLLAERLAREIRREPHEECVVALLDKTDHVLAMLRFSEGNTLQTIAPFRLIFGKALAINAAALALAHNHPSGIASPSQHDCDFTRKLAMLCTALNITLVDHWVVTEGDRYSFRENGLI